MHRHIAVREIERNRFFADQAAIPGVTDRHCAAAAIRIIRT